MSDLIRRTEAIKRIRVLWSEAWGDLGDHYYDNEYAKALQDAIDAIVDCFDAEQTEPKNRKDLEREAKRLKRLIVEKMENLVDKLEAEQTEPITQDDYVDSGNDYVEQTTENPSTVKHNDCYICGECGSFKCTKCDGRMYWKPQTEPKEV